MNIFFLKCYDMGVFYLPMNHGTLRAFFDLMCGVVDGAYGFEYPSGAVMFFFVGHVVVMIRFRKVQAIQKKPIQPDECLQMVEHLRTFDAPMRSLFS